MHTGASSDCGQNMIVRCSGAVFQGNARVVAIKKYEYGGGAGTAAIEKLVERVRLRYQYNFLVLVQISKGSGMARYYEWRNFIYNFIHLH